MWQTQYCEKELTLKGSFLAISPLFPVAFMSQMGPFCKKGRRDAFASRKRSTNTDHSTSLISVSTSSNDKRQSSTYHTLSRRPPISP